MSNISDVKHSCSYSCWSFSAFFGAALKIGELFGPTTNYPEVPLDKNIQKTLDLELLKINWHNSVCIHQCFIIFCLNLWLTIEQKRWCMYKKKSYIFLYILIYFYLLILNNICEHALAETTWMRLTFVFQMYWNTSKKNSHPNMYNKDATQEGEHVSRIGQMGINGSPGGERTKTTTKHTNQCGIGRKDYQQYNNTI